VCVDACARAQVDAFIHPHVVPLALVEPV